MRSAGVWEADGDEFCMLAENAAEVGLGWSGPPAVRRTAVDVAPGRQISAVVWGREPPEMVLIHGGAQNAHTWDTVALALDRPLVALDLPGHGHSGWREDGDYRPATVAADVAVALDLLAPDAGLVVGMSLGGLSAICLASRRADLVNRLALVDITPGTDRVKAEPILAFLSGPERFGSFQEMLDRTVAYNPSRTLPSLRRGVIHNARESGDGSWTWRWDPAVAQPPRQAPAVGSGDLWTAVDELRMPLLLLRGARSSVVSDGDVAEFRRRQPDTRVEVVAGAGHSIQSDQPLELARQLAGFLAG
jgi:pimeloyl-ACP methyl ester carboxylesterase